MKKIYRYVVDGIEEYTTGLSDMILVNSSEHFFPFPFTPFGIYCISFVSLEFTGSIVKETFPRIVAKQTPKVNEAKNNKLSIDCAL